MDPTTTAPTAQGHSQSHSSTPESAGASPANRSICNCDTPSDETYLQPIIGCVNRKCRPRYYHLRCVGLIHSPRDPLSWLCPTCQPDRQLPPPVCICKDNPPYQFGPMVECTQKDRCATRWFHFPCVYVYPGQDTSQWVCPECSVDVFMRKEREKELEERRARGELDEEEEEHEQHQYVTDDVPGTFINEGTELPRASPDVAPQASPTGASSPLKRKSDDSADDTSHKKVKTSEDAPSAAATPLNTSPQPPTTNLGADNDVAPSPPSESTLSVDSGLPAVGASRDTPSPLASDSEAFVSAREDVLSEEDDDDDGDESESNRYCNRACRRETGAMVACDSADCVGEWFHFACVGLTPGTVPEGEWFCDDCAAVLEEERKMKKKGGKGKGRG